MYDILNRVYDFYHSENFAIMHERYMCLSTNCFDRIYSISCDNDYTKKTGIITIHFIYFDNETTAMFPVCYNNMMNYYMESTDYILSNVDNFMIIIDVNSSFFAKKKNQIKIKEPKISFSCNCSYLLIANLIEVTNKSLHLSHYNFMCTHKALMLAFNGLNNCSIYTCQSIKLYNFKGLIGCLKDLYNIGQLKGNDLYLKYSQIYTNYLNEYVNNTFCYHDFELNFLKSYISQYSYTFFYALILKNKIKTENLILKFGRLNISKSPIDDTMNNILKVLGLDSLEYKHIFFNQFNIPSYEYILSFQNILHSFISEKIFEINYNVYMDKEDEQEFRNFLIQHKDDILFRSLTTGKRYEEE